MAVNSYGSQDGDPRSSLGSTSLHPCDRFCGKGHKSFKLVTQLIKILIVTIQLILFGLSSQMVVNFKEENIITVKHLFLKDYSDGSEETHVAYTQADVSDHMFYAVDKYLAIPNETSGGYEYVHKAGTNQLALMLCQQHYYKGRIDPANDTFNIDLKVITECLGVDAPMKMASPLDTEDIIPSHVEPDLSYRDFTLKFYNIKIVLRCFTFAVPEERFDFRYGLLSAQGA
uniref:Mucolipin extracytosolic domain-containing protein n=1 Tax=Salvator merianae TaxID=96440 RepID=A0A8D0E8N3_SALMN